MRDKRIINKFYVFYRISDNGNRNKKKLDCATKINCLKNAINTFNKANIVVFIDGVIQETDEAIHKLCDGLENIKLKYIHCGSNPKSLRALYTEALTLNDNDFVYFLEDDYLHLKDSQSVLIEFAEENYTDYVTLYDHPDKYEEGCVNVNPYCKNFGERTFLFRTANHHWKITNSTTDTFASFVDVLKRDKEILWKHTSENIGHDFERWVELYKNGKFLSSPIPSLSTHCEVLFLAPLINWDKEPIGNKCCVVFVTHKEKLNGKDEMAFNQMINVFSPKRDIFLVLPDEISQENYEKSIENEKILRMPNKYFESVKTYNTMLCNREFWYQFIKYDYCLIYQDDCWAFRDDLDYFMSLKYDWYGAPWPREPINNKLNCVGNGGFSLRNVNKMISITSNTNEENNKEGLAEDLWFCVKHNKELDICDLKTASNFSQEVKNDYFFSLIDTVPMGLHGKLMSNYWDLSGMKFIEYKK